MSLLEYFTAFQPDLQLFFGPGTSTANKTGIDQAPPSKYETGERIPTTENLIALADYFDTSLDFLMDRTPERKPYPIK